jgi:outer membrane protein
MRKSPEHRISDPPDPRRRRHQRSFLVLTSAVALAMLASCASMKSLTKRTAGSPAEPWVPPASQGKGPAPAPLPSPDIPAGLQQPGQAWKLADMVAVGLANNPQTRAAWNAARAASAAVSISKGEYLPAVNLSLPANTQKLAFAGGKFIVKQQTLTPQASLSWLLFDFWGREADIQSARQALEAANWNQNAVFQSVILHVESSYYRYLAAKAVLQAQETSRQGAQANFDAATARHQAGLATIADVLQAKTALSTIDLNLVTTRGLIQTLHGALANAMGLPAATPFEVTVDLPPILPIEEVAKQVDLCIKEAEARRPDLAAARAQVLGAEAAVQKARSLLFPSFSLTGGIGRTYYEGLPTSNPYYTLSLNINLAFMFGLQQYGVLAAKAQAETARDQAAELSRGIELQVWTSYYGLKTAEQKIANSRDLLESAQASYDVALGRYKGGVGSILDLLTAQDTLENARVQTVLAKADWFLSLVQFTHDTGVLEPPAAPSKPGLPSNPEKGDHRP